MLADRPEPTGSKEQSCPVLGEREWSSQLQEEEGEPGACIEGEVGEVREHKRGKWGKSVLWLRLPSTGQQRNLPSTGQQQQRWKEVVMTLAEANAVIRERLDRQLDLWRPNDAYPEYIKTESDDGPVPTEDDTNNQAQRWAEGE